MKYILTLTDEAEDDLKYWQRSGQKKTFNKILKLFEELRQHPTTGTGQVEQLKGDLAGYWSRRIDKGSRMIYRIDDGVIVVTVISLKGHYSDK